MLKVCRKASILLRSAAPLHSFVNGNNGVFCLSSAENVSSSLLDLHEGLRFYSRFHSVASRIAVPRLTSLPYQCNFSTREGSSEDEEISIDVEGGEECAEDEDDGAFDLLSKPETASPRFVDSVEEAAYIGYKVVGRAKEGDFGPYKPPNAFAVVQVGSHQFKISPGDCIYTEKLKYADVNDKLSLEKVLLLGSKSQTIIGRPFVPKAFVHAAVEEQVLDAKVIIFKKKRRKNYRRCNGHRQELTRLRILEIWGLGEARSSFV
ncbi:hypothetical protein KP509_36G065300 [Ceratopteris richardii]|nr:hypothetical protein KP509_36G065300 [Ceratopteris richardii]